VLEQATDEIRDEIGAQRPARAEVAEDPGHVGHAGEQGAAPRYGVLEGERLAVDLERDVPQHIEVEPGRGDDDIGLETIARREPDAAGIERLDMVGHDGGGAGGDRPEQVAVGNEGDALAPGPVTGGEVPLDVEVVAEMGAN